MLRASIVAERAGFPAVSLVGSLYERHAVTAARYLGVEDPPLAVYPGRIDLEDDETFRAKIVGVVTDQVVSGLTTTSTGRRSPAGSTCRRGLAAGRLAIWRRGPGTAGSATTAVV